MYHCSVNFREWNPVVSTGNPCNLEFRTRAKISLQRFCNTFKLVTQICHIAQQCYINKQWTFFCLQNFSNVNFNFSLILWQEVQDLTQQLMSISIQLVTDTISNWNVPWTSVSHVCLASVIHSKHGASLNIQHLVCLCALCRSEIPLLHSTV